MKNFSGNVVEQKLIYLLLLFTIGILICLRFYYATSFAATWDTVDFALGVQQFDLLEMQPHFPGYPYFILGGMLINIWIDDPVRALSIFNVYMSILSMIPMFLIAKRYMSVQHSLLFLLYMQSLIYFSLLTTQPMSEVAAISWLWWYIWALLLSLESNKLSIKLLPPLFLSLILGVRLSYIPFAVGLILIWWQEYRTFKGKKLFVRLSIQVGLAAGFQFIWVYGLAASLGGIPSLLQIGLSFTKGHFNDWGGAIFASNESMASRFYQFYIENILWTGFFGRSIVMIGLVSLSLVIMIRMMKPTFMELTKLRLYHIIVLLFFAYMLWAFFAQNTEKARHILPLVIVLAMIFYFVIMKSPLLKIKTYVILFISIIQVIYSGYWMERQATELPSTYLLAEYVNQLEEPLILYTWEETRVLDYLQVSFEHKRIWTYENFVAEVNFHTKKRIFLTDHVIEGFKRQGKNVSDHIKVVARFKSSDMIYPVYNYITLYEWN